MTAVQRWAVRLAVLSEVVGLLFVGVAVYSLAILVFDKANSALGEYALGVWFGVLYGFGALLLATFLAIGVKKVLPKTLFGLLTMPTLIVGIVLLVMYFYGVAADGLARAT
jgi:hypothetical protein